jgi:hypothetical protein
LKTIFGGKIQSLTCTTQNVSNAIKFPTIFYLQKFNTNNFLLLLFFIESTHANGNSLIVIHSLQISSAWADKYLCKGKGW